VGSSPSAGSLFFSSCRIGFYKNRPESYARSM